MKNSLRIERKFEKGDVRVAYRGVTVWSGEQLKEMPHSYSSIDHLVYEALGEDSYDGIYHLEGVKITIEVENVVSRR